MIKKYPEPEEIPQDLKRYISMCERAKEDEDISEVSDRYFEKGDFFFHPVMGVDIVEINLGNGFMYCSHPELKTTRIPIDKCTWLPTVEQIKEMARSENLFNVEQEEKVIDPKNFYKTPEEKWLALYIFWRYKGKFWFAPESEWKDKKEKGS